MGLRNKTKYRRRQYLGNGRRYCLVGGSNGAMENDII